MPCGAAGKMLKGGFMIQLTTLDGQTFLINEDYMESVIQNPDTVILMRSGRSLIVKESIDEIIRAIEAYNNKIHRNLASR